MASAEYFVSFLTAAVLLALSCPAQSMQSPSKNTGNLEPLSKVRILPGPVHTGASQSGFECSLPGKELLDELRQYSSFNICPDTTTTNSWRKACSTGNATRAEELQDLRWEVVHGRHCLQSAVNAYSQAEKRRLQLKEAYEALLHEKQLLEKLLWEQRKGRLESSLLWAVIACVCGYLAPRLLQGLKLGSVRSILWGMIGRCCGPILHLLLCVPFLLEHF